MFKLLSISILIYLLYRFIFTPGQEGYLSAKEKEKLNKKAGDDSEYIDYEEVD